MESETKVQKIQEEQGDGGKSKNVGKTIKQMKKYYTPKIEEFHEGFEYEIFEDWDTLPKKSWHKQVFGKDGDDPERLGYVTNGGLRRFRVKHLDRKDIEDEGWTFLSQEDQICSHYEMKTGTVVAALWKLRLERDGRVWIRQGLHAHTRFLGTINNKSELKVVLRQIGINPNRAI